MDTPKLLYVRLLFLTTVNGREYPAESLELCIEKTANQVLSTTTPLSEKQKPIFNELLKLAYALLHHYNEESAKPLQIIVPHIISILNSVDIADPSNEVIVQQICNCLVMFPVDIWFIDPTRTMKSLVEILRGDLARSDLDDHIVAPVLSSIFAVMQENTGEFQTPQDPDGSTSWQHVMSQNLQPTEE